MTVNLCVDYTRIYMSKKRAIDVAIFLKNKNSNALHRIPFSVQLYLSSKMFPIRLLGDDPSLGRLDYASLSQQALMEVLVENISNKELITGSPDQSVDISEWLNVDVDNEKVWMIEWHDTKLKGSIDLQWLPASLEEINISKNSLSGTLVTDLLPANISRVNISGNLFFGSIALEKLPAALLELFANSNSFEGTVNLGHLPEKMISLSMSENNLTGTLNLTSLPRSLKHLNFSFNSFEGTPDLTQLPKHLKDLILNNNSLEGETDFSKFPDSLTYCNLQSTNLTGKMFMGWHQEFLVNQFQIEVIPTCGQQLF